MRIILKTIVVNAVGIFFAGLVTVAVSIMVSGAVGSAAFASLQGKVTKDLLRQVKLAKRKKPFENILRDLTKFQIIAGSQQSKATAKPKETKEIVAKAQKTRGRSKSDANNPKLGFFKRFRKSRAAKVDFNKQEAEVLEMAGGWSVLATWKRGLKQARQQYKEDKISERELADKELSIIKELGKRVTKEIKPMDGYFDLSPVVKERKADCLGYTQVLYILGKEIGFKVEPMEVTELLTHQILIESIHVACLFTLFDGKQVMVDGAMVKAMDNGATVPGFIGSPFTLETEFKKIDNYWEQKKESQFLLHRRIRILDRNGLIALVYINQGTLLKRLKQHQRAISCYNEALRLDPKNAGAYNDLGFVYYKLGKYQEALKSFKKFLKYAPGSSRKYKDMVENQVIPELKEKMRQQDQSR